MLSSLFMQVSMSITTPATLPVCRSVLIESGMKPSAIAGTACRNQKLPAPCPRSKITPAFPRLVHVVEDLAVVIDGRELLGEDMGVDIARPHFLQDQLGIGLRRQVREEIDHHRHPGDVAGLDRAVDRHPGRVRGVEVPFRPVVRGLDADHDVACIGAVPAASAGFISAASCSQAPPMPEPTILT